MLENSFSGQEPETPHEGTNSFAPVPQVEKWFPKAFVGRSKARPWRMEKLNMAQMFRESPGFDFLIECWDDDPALRIVIKKLLVKFPQWGIACVDGKLINWNG